MIISVNKEKMLAKVELHRGGKSDHTIMWYSLSKDVAEYYGQRNQEKVKTIVIDLPIRELVKDRHGDYRVRFAINSPYIYGINGAYSVGGVNVTLNELSSWIDVPLNDVFSLEAESVPVGMDIDVNLCLGKSWLENVQAV